MSPLPQPSPDPSAKPRARDRKRAAVLAAAVVAYCLVAMSVLLKRFGPPPGVAVYMADGSEGMHYKFLRNFRHLATPMGPLLMITVINKYDNGNADDIDNADAHDSANQHDDDDHRDDNERST